MKVKVLVNLKTQNGIVQAGTQYNCDLTDMPESIQQEIIANRNTIQILDNPTLVLSAAPKVEIRRQVESVETPPVHIKTSKRGRPKK